MALRLSPFQGKAVDSPMVAADPSKSSWRVDVVSDTHGQLSDELLETLRGADLIVHAGDFCSLADYQTLRRIAPLKGCLGNNDWNMDYGPDVKNVVRFTYAGLRWQVVHYQERLDLATCDVAVCGHTHRPIVEREGSTLLVNPGSPTFPRTSQGPTCARIMLEAGESDPAEVAAGRAKARIASAEIIQLRPQEEEYSPWTRFFKQI